jgi:hypothetical protein
MRIKSLGLALIVSGLIAPLAIAAPEIDQPSNSVSPKKERVITVSDVKNLITPHRALYNIKLAGTKNGSSVSDITGKMFFSWADDCNDWSVEQKMQIRFYYSEGEVADTTSSLISREAKDGSSYIFHVKRTGNGDDADISRGSAKLSVDANGLGTGEASATGKDTKTYPLKSATTFPVHHTLQILAHALSGKKFFAVNVFDGADENGLNEISAFIGNPIPPAPVVEKANSSPTDNALTRSKAWPVRMAFFAPDSKTGSPDYEMDMTLQENGVIKSMTVDYDDFAMKAELVKVESLPPSKCSSPKAAMAMPTP